VIVVRGALDARRHPGVRDGEHSFVIDHTKVLRFEEGDAPPSLLDGADAVSSPATTSSSPLHAFLGPLLEDARRRRIPVLFDPSSFALIEAFGRAGSRKAWARSTCCWRMTRRPTRSGGRPSSRWKPGPARGREAGSARRLAYAPVTPGTPRPTGDGRRHDGAGDAFDAAFIVEWLASRNVEPPSRPGTGWVRTWPATSVPSRPAGLARRPPGPTLVGRRHRIAGPCDGSGRSRPLACRPTAPCAAVVALLQTEAREGVRRAAKRRGHPSVEHPAVHRGARYGRSVHDLAHETGVSTRTIYRDSTPCSRWGFRSSTRSGTAAPTGSSTRTVQAPHGAGVLAVRVVRAVSQPPPRGVAHRHPVPERARRGLQQVRARDPDEDAGVSRASAGGHDAKRRAARSASRRRTTHGRSARGGVRRPQQVQMRYYSLSSAREDDTSSTDQFVYTQGAMYLRAWVPAASWS